MDLTAQFRASLLAQSFPPPSTTFLTSLLATRSPPPPLPSLLATAKARLLACDLTTSTSVDRAMLAALPSTTTASSSSSSSSSSNNNNNHANRNSAITNNNNAPVASAAAAAKEIRIQRDVHVQVLDVENLSASRWEQVEELEAVARGERTRGRQVVRVVPADDDDGTTDASQTQTQTQTTTSTTTTTTTSQARGAAGSGIPTATAAVPAGPNATHRLVLQDHQGNRIYAVELRRVDRIAVGRTGIGEKMVLRAGTVISRGSVLLTPETCTVLGGRVEAWHEAWLQGRLARLKEAVGGGDGPR
ncbi:hypothetical protein JDV02_003793 [Purpureocillium takamizusanense]|uniref:RecQ mediated genome instability protein 1-like N-terminal helical domain-containing protein n=1 Tax=Purpureocillium takamizusanense TaxID=2060973 RepID=A0A9Q8QEW0_9HYPO|nr:uncharacterized protein JDV02_003793 [Purpureocillium takamizusanense]UNI17452.1 hypothetical protein JDV02_003793 [Purpureocillium takamizusanense]